MAFNCMFCKTRVKRTQGTLRLRYGFQKPAYTLHGYQQAKLICLVEKRVLDHM